VARVSWWRLPWRAKLFRLAHVAWSIVGLSTLAHVSLCAISGRRDGALPASIGFLSIEGVALVLGRGNCPLGPFQRELGDPVPLFELVLPRRAGKAAIPVLVSASVGGIAVIAVQELRRLRTMSRPRVEAVDLSAGSFDLNR
jgi:hypothetical protein